jgi:Ca2+-binding RTX toxin-like protein
MVGSEDVAADDSVKLTELAASGASDIAMSPDGSRIYVARQGNVIVFDTATGNQVQSWTVGGTLGAMSVSEDGAFLLVLAANGTVVHRVATATGAVTNFAVPSELLAFDIETTDGTHAIVTFQVPPGVNNGTARSLDFSTGAFTDLSLPGFGGAAHLSESGRYVLAGLHGVGNGPMAVYDSVTDQFIAFGDNTQPDVLHGANFGTQAISEARGLIAQFNAQSSINIFDLMLDGVRTIEALPIEADALAFDPTGSLLYMHFADTDEMIVVETTDFTVVDRFQTEASDVFGSRVGRGAQLHISPDGKHLVLRDPRSGQVVLIDLSVRDNIVNGTTGADALDGGKGDDIYLVDHLGDTVTERAFQGNDRVNAAVDFHLGAGSAVETIAAADLAATTPLALSGNELANLLLGNAGNNRLAGGGGDDRIEGGAGNDRLDGGAGADVMIGGSGDDVYVVGQAGDQVIDSAGVDTVEASITYILGAGIENLTLTGNVSLNGTGNELANTLTGSNAGALLYGLLGNDRLFGGTGTDFLDGGEGDDMLSDAGGHNTLVGGAGADTLVSTATDGGNLFASHLYNGFENLDTLAEVDTLVGGGGNDLFWAGFNDSVDGGNGGENTLSLNLQGSAAGVRIDFRPLESGGTVANGTGTIRSITGLSTIIGSQGNDQITGFSDAAIFPFSGLTLDGRDGNDLLVGGAGGDRLLGESGADTLRGGDGRDSIFAAGEDYDPAITDTFRDALYGEGGDDALSAGRGDTVDGGEGIDSLFLNLANATAGVTLDIADLATATGVTLFTGTIRNIEVISGLILPNAGNMVNLAGQAGESSLPIFGGTARDVLIGSGFRDQLYGGDGDDELRSGAGNDHVEGGAGNDLLAGGAGRDSLFGGTGVDTVSYDDAASAVTISLLSNYGTDFANNVDVLNSIENAIGSRFADAITGDNVSNDLYGGEGDDTIDGRGGSDDIFGDAGNDILTGGLGSDVIDGGSGADRMYGGQNNDSYRVDDSADLIFENADDGVDSVIASASHYLFANVEHLELAAGAGDLFGVGNALGNMITGNEGSNLLLGGGGEDVLRGGGGVDSLFGESGADHLFGDAGIDYLVGGIGNDILDGGADADLLYGEDGDDTLIGGDGFVTDILVGGAGSDIFRGNSGLGDYDLMDGGAGDDHYYVDTPDDLTFEAVGGGADTVYANISGAGYYLYANTENLVLEGNTPFGVGNALDNRITGNAANNYLLGGAGNDTLSGMGGNDVLFGEAGADIFVFGRNNGADVVGDFQRGSDRIDLSAYAASNNPGAAAIFESLRTNFRQVGADGAIDLGGGNLIVLHNVTMSELTVDDFILTPIPPAVPKLAAIQDRDFVSLQGGPDLADIFASSRSGSSFDHLAWF